MALKSLVLVLCMGFGSPLARAQSGPDERARDLYESGKEYYQAGKYTEALIAFETAYRLSGRNNLLRSIGYCYEKLDRLQEALATYHRWMVVADAEKLEEVERHIRRIERLIEEEVVATHAARVEAQRAAAAAVAPTPAPPPVAAPPAVAEPPPPPPPEPRAPWRISAGPSALYGLGAAAGIAGTVLAVQAGQARTEAGNACSTGDAILCRDTASAALQRDSLFSVLADANFGLTGAAIVGATIWMIVDNRSGPVAVSIAPTGVGVRGQF
ncbi:MAG: hypothetical protein VX944_09765 [Myxococcota bacterium]|nr:hypothetical protein [Myxococcota bacterium]